MVDNTKFPPGDWIGYSIDLTTLSSPQIDGVQAAVIKSTRLIILDFDNSTEIPVNNSTYKVPGNIDLETTVKNAQISFVTYPTGSEASQKLQADTSLAETLLPLASAVSTTRWIRDLFVDDHQYALFGYAQGQYLAQLADFGEFINEDALKAKLRDLPPFDSDVKASVHAWRQFFRTTGSHIITGTKYGARFQLMVSAANDKQPFAGHFPDDVAAAYHGLPTSGKFDADILKQRQFKKFLKERHEDANCVGGDGQLAEQLVHNLGDPNIINTFQSWSQSTDNAPTVISFVLMSLWDLMPFAMDPDVSGRAVDVQKAFDWTLEHPQEHWTRGTFSVTSDWGEIILLSPGAYFRLPEDNLPNLPDGVQFESTKIFFGKQDSGLLPPHPAVSFDFIILNDGTPVDIGLSHGSDGTAYGVGSCEALIYDTIYTNNKRGDDKFNTLYFKKCPVDPSIHEDSN